MTEIVSKPDHGSPIGEAEGNPVIASDIFQDYLDDIEEALNTNLLGNVVQLPAFVVAKLPDPTKTTGGQLFVTDEVGGPVPAFSDGTNWLRCTDRAIVS